MGTWRKCAYQLCLWTGKYLIASSLIHSALYKRSVATAVIKGKFLGILDAVPLLLVTLEKSGHCWAVVAPGVQGECQQLLRIIFPLLPAATELCSQKWWGTGAFPWLGLAWQWPSWSILVPVPRGSRRRA